MNHYHHHHHHHHHRNKNYHPSSLHCRWTSTKPASWKRRSRSFWSWPKIWRFSFDCWMLSWMIVVDYNLPGISRWEWWESSAAWGKSKDPQRDSSESGKVFFQRQLILHVSVLSGLMKTVEWRLRSWKRNRWSLPSWERSSRTRMLTSSPRMPTSLRKWPRSRTSKGWLRFYHSACFNFFWVLVTFFF